MTGLGDMSGTCDSIPLQTVVGAVTTHTQDYLRDELGLSVTAGAAAINAVQRIDLRDLTAVVSFGGPVNIFIAFSFEAALMDYLTDAMTEGLDLDDLDRESLRQDVAGELINIVIGNSTATLQPPDRSITMSPPITLVGSKSVLRSRDAIFGTVPLRTQHGALDLDFVGPRELFSEPFVAVGESE